MAPLSQELSTLTPTLNMPDKLASIAIKPREEEVKQHRAEYLQVFDKLPDGERAFIEPMLNRVFSFIGLGELKRAYLTIVTYPAPTASLQSAIAEAAAVFSKFNL